MIHFKLLLPTNLGAALKDVQWYLTYRNSDYIHSVLHSTRKYLFALIQYPGKASILVSTIQCYTKLIFEFTQKIHAQNSVWQGSFFLTDQGLHLGLENGHLWITKYLFYQKLLNMVFTFFVTKMVGKNKATSKTCPAIMYFFNTHWITSKHYCTKGKNTKLSHP